MENFTDFSTKYFDCIRIFTPGTRVFSPSFPQFFHNFSTIDGNFPQAIASEEGMGWVENPSDSLLRGFTRKVNAIAQLPEQIPHFHIIILKRRNFFATVHHRRMVFPPKLLPNLR